MLEIDLAVAAKGRPVLLGHGLVLLVEANAHRRTRRRGEAAGKGRRLVNKEELRHDER